MDDEPEDTRPLINIHVTSNGVQLAVGGLPFSPTLDAGQARRFGKRMGEAADLWEKCYRAFVHDETDTLH